MTRFAILPVFAVLLFAAAPASADPGLDSGLPLFQYGDDYGLGGGGGGGAAARDLNIRLSGYFTAIPFFSTEFYDEDDAATWTEVWDTGLGGGLEIGYHIAPGFRLGFGSGYWVFPGKEDEAGSTSVEWDDMTMIPFALEMAFCFPFDLPSTAWFKGGRSFVPGVVPYLALDVAGLYRPEVTAEVHIGSWTMEANIFDSCFTFGVGGRLGIEYRGATFGVFADFGFRYFTAPKDSDDFDEKILEMIAWPARLGFAIYFGGTSGGGGGGY